MTAFKTAWFHGAIYGTILLATAGQAMADILASHAMVDAYTLYGGLEYAPGQFHPGDQVRLEGNGALDTGLLQDSASPGGDVLYSAQAQARVSPTSSSLLGVRSSGFSNDARQFTPVGNGMGVAAWRDVAFVAGSTPAVIRLSFEVRGSLYALITAEPPWGSTAQNWAQIGVRTSTTDGYSAANFFDDGNLAANHSVDAWPYEARVWLPDTSYEAYGPWDSIHEVGTDTFGDGGWFRKSAYDFVGTLHMDVPYDPSLGGYGWGIALSARSHSIGGETDTSSFHSLAIVAATLPDGTPLSVSFDSGLQLVPEPSSIMLVAAGCVVLLTATARRRRGGH